MRCAHAVEASKEDSLGRCIAPGIRADGDRSAETEPGFARWWWYKPHMSCRGMY